LSNPATSPGWVCAFCIVPVLAMIAVALLVLSPARHRGAAGTASSGSFTSQPGTVTPAARGRIQASYAALPLAFEQNQGQTDTQVKYMARGNGYTLFLTAKAAVFSLQSRSAESAPSTVRRGAELRAKSLPEQRNAQEDSTAVVRMQLVGGNSLAKIAASDQVPGKSNYFVGNDPSKWRRDVAHYARVSYENVYPGVNMAFHGAQRQFEFDFVVAPGANPAPIGFLFTGAQGMKTDDSGNLVISSAAGDVLLHKPVAYQERQGARQAVDARFLLKSGNKVSFELGDYDRSRELVIDPSVSYEYSTYLGGTDDDEGYAIAFDSSGNAYVTGQTASPTFPGASGTLPDAAAVFVTKIDADGSSLLYSTYVGGTGTGTDSGNGIAVDASGDAFVAGGTTSTTFPTTSVAFQKTLKGAGNAFVFELVPDGTSLTYCTYLGGSGNDVALGIALDSAGNAYPVGETSSTDFPTSPNPLQGYVAGSKASGFVTKLNSLGTALVYSTYLGGSSAGDFVGAVALDSSDNVYVTGQTFSSSFPTTTGAFQPKCGSCSGGDSDAFVTKLSPTGSALLYSTFLGGSGTDIGDGIAVDSSGNAYVTGLTGSTDFPLQSALQTALGGADDAFVTKLNPAGSALVYSTFLGGSQPDGAVTFGASIAVDSSGYAYLTGQTSSTDFPLQSALQSTYGGGSTDAFVSEINSTGSALAFSTYLGGSQDEDDSGSYGAIAVDSVGANIYVTGSTLSINFPTFPTQSPYQKNNAGGTDAFVAKYAQSQSFSIVATTPAAVAPGTSGTSMVTLTAFHGYSSPVNLSCSVSGTGSPLPACSTTSFSPGQVTPTAVGATSTLTITTTAANAAMFVPRKVFYAMWLPIAGMSLVGIAFGSAHSRRRKVLGFLMIGMVVAGLLLMPACGGSSSSGGGGGGGGGGTPAGSYTVTITGTGTDTNTTTQSTQVTLTVN
jgi:hypothetical protein